MTPGNANTTELGIHHTPTHLDHVRTAWLWVVVLGSLFGFQEALEVARGVTVGSLVPMPMPIDIELVGALVVSTAAWVAALVWAHPRATTMRSEPQRARAWYMASFSLAFVGTAAAMLGASNHRRHGLALSCYLTSLALLVFMYPRARAFPIEEPPPPIPACNEALEIKRFACPHCGAKTFALGDKLQMRSGVLHACRKCRAWVTVPWWWDALRPGAIVLSVQGLPRIIDRLSATAGVSLLLTIVLFPMMAGMWVAVSMLVPLVTRYPPPLRSIGQSR